MDQEIIIADIRYRNRVLIYVLVIAILSAILFQFGFPLLERWLQKMETVKAIKTIATILFFLFLAPLPLGFKFLSLSNHILREGRYPPEGTKVIYDQIIIRGDKAKLRAYLFMVMAFLVFFISIFCAFAAQIFVKMLVTTGSIL